jgi:hypothetical protein
MATHTIKFSKPVTSPTETVLKQDVAGIKFSKTGANPESVEPDTNNTTPGSTTGKGTDTIEYEVGWAVDPVAGDVVTYEYTAASGYYYEEGGDPTDDALKDSELDIINCLDTPTVITPIPTQSWAVNDPVVPIDCAASFDTTGHTGLVYSASGLPAGMYINSSEGFIYGATSSPVAGGTIVVTLTTDYGQASTSFEYSVADVAFPNIVPTNIELLDQDSIENHWVAQGAISPIEFDPTVEINGIGSLLGGVLDGTFSGQAKTNIPNGMIAAPWDWSADKIYGLWVYFPNRSGSVYSENIMFSTVATDKATFPTFMRNFPRKGWHWMGGDKSMYVPAGSMDFTNIIECRLSIYNTGSVGDEQINWSNFIESDKPKAKVSWIFDDNNESDYTHAFPILASYGWVGSSAIIGSALGTGGKLTNAQLDEMYAAGWDIVNHGWLSTAWTGHVDKGEQDMLDGYDAIATNWPRGASTVVYPGGQVDDGVLDAMEGYINDKVKVARLVGDAFSNAVPQVRKPDDSNAVCIDMQLIPSVAIKEDNNPNVVSACTDYIDKAIVNGGYASLHGHMIVDSGATGIAANVADFIAVCDYMKAKEEAGELEVLTITQWQTLVNT